MKSIKYLQEEEPLLLPSHEKIGETNFADKIIKKTSKFNT
jgi:hypothetical protein